MKYYEVTAMIDGEKEVLYGSYQKADCVYEKEAEKEGWKDQGYKKIKIEVRDVSETPDEEIYDNEIVTSEELFQQQAPSFNFELDKDELLEHALNTGFITDIGNGKYLINTEY